MKTAAEVVDQPCFVLALVFFVFFVEVPRDELDGFLAVVLGKVFPLAMKYGRCVCVKFMINHGRRLRILINGCGLHEFVFVMA